MYFQFLVSLIDFRYITDVITKEEAIALLKSQEAGKSNRISVLERDGYPCYTTQVGWYGYSDEKVRRLCKEYLNQGYTAFKTKVGLDIETDRKRCALIREEIGYENKLVMSELIIFSLPHLKLIFGSRWWTRIKFGEFKKQ